MRKMPKGCIVWLASRALVNMRRKRWVKVTKLHENTRKRAIFGVTKMVCKHHLGKPCPQLLGE